MDSDGGAYGYRNGYTNEHFDPHVYCNPDAAGHAYADFHRHRYRDSDSGE
jgi:hypothetical protein